MQTKLVQTDLLSVKEKAWLNEYNAEVLQKVGPLLDHDPRALAWLKRECKPV